MLSKVVEAIESAGDGVATLRAVLHLEGPWDGRPSVLSFRNGNYVDRIGWKDIVVESDSSFVFRKETLLRSIEHKT